MGFLSETMKACWDDMIGFGMVFSMFFIGFVLMFYMFLNRYLYEWSNFIVASETSFSMLLGKLSFEDIKNANIVAALFFFCYALAMAIIMINIFFTIIIRAFEDVKRELARRPNDIEVIEYMKSRLGTFVGIKKVLLLDISKIFPIQIYLPIFKNLPQSFILQGF